MLNIYTKFIRKELFNASITAWYLQECKNYENGIIEDINVNWIPLHGSYEIYLYNLYGVIFYKEIHKCKTSQEMFKRARYLKLYYERKTNVKLK